MTTQQRTGITWEIVDEEVSSFAWGIGQRHGNPEVGFNVLREAAALELAAKERVKHTVACARKNGATWEQIGRAIGVSKQAAQQRFGGS